MAPDGQRLGRPAPQSARRGAGSPGRRRWGVPVKAAPTSSNHRRRDGCAPFAPRWKLRAPTEEGQRIDAPSLRRRVPLRRSAARKQLDNSMAGSGFFCRCQPFLIVSAEARPPQSQSTANHRRSSSGPRHQPLVCHPARTGVHDRPLCRQFVPLGLFLISGWPVITSRARCKSASKFPDPH